jgi:hypothetical protein
VTTAVLLVVLAAVLAGTALGYAFLREALDLLASMVRAWRAEGGMGALAVGSPFVVLFAAFLTGIFLALALGTAAAAATLGRAVLRWRGLGVRRRDVVYLVLLSSAANVGVFLGLAWLEPATTLPPALDRHEVVLALAGFLGLVAIAASLVAGSILRAHPAPPAPPTPPAPPPAPPAPQDSPPA